MNIQRWAKRITALSARDIFQRSLFRQLYFQVTAAKNMKRGKAMINAEDFDKVEVRVGTITEVSINKKARKPAYKLKVDLGEEIGIKTSSAQITELYSPEDLIGTQAVFCVNLTPMHIGSVKSEVRILGSDSSQGVVLLRPTEPVINGDRIF